MKLNVKTSYYVLGATCGCTKNQQALCGITYRSGN
jgi:hypothetical protein